jgi:hypothetical protein
MYYSYLTSTASHLDKGEIHDVWGYKFRWTSQHLTEEYLKPLRYQYDTCGEEVLQRLNESRKIKSPDKATQAGDWIQGVKKSPDLLELLKVCALSGGDPLLDKFWKDVHTVPEWVDWQQIKRGQEVRDALCTVIDRMC